VELQQLAVDTGGMFFMSDNASFAAGALYERISQHEQKH